MPCLSCVRIATEADRMEIWRLFLGGHKENGLFSLSPEKVDYFLTRVLNPHLIPHGDIGPRGAIGVIGPVGHLEGIVFVTIGSYWYSNDKHIEEFIVYVDPECRVSNHAKALIQWMKDQVEATGLPLVTGILSTERTEAKCRLYRRFLPRAGEFFYLAPKNCIVPQLAAGSSW